MTRQISQIALVFLVLASISVHTSVASQYSQQYPQQYQQQYSQQYPQQGQPYGQQMQQYPQHMQQYPHQYPQQMSQYGQPMQGYPQQMQQPQAPQQQAPHQNFLQNAQQFGALGMQAFQQGKQMYSAHKKQGKGELTEEDETVLEDVEELIKSSKEEIKCKNDEGKLIKVKTKWIEKGLQNKPPTIDVEKKGSDYLLHYKSKKTGKERTYTCHRSSFSS